MQIPCPTCRTPLAVPDSALGKAVRCPKCTNVFTAEAPIEAVEVAPVLPAVTPPSVVPIALPVEPSPPVSPLTDEPGGLQPSPTPMDEAPWTQSPTNPLDFADRNAPIIRMTNQTRAQAKRAGSWLVMGAGLHIFLTDFASWDWAYSTAVSWARDRRTCSAKHAVSSSASRSAPL
jgi:predicted Zn finger-like uncharacterized protein